MASWQSGEGVMFMDQNVMAAFPPHLVLLLLLVAPSKRNKGGVSFRSSIYTNRNREAVICQSRANDSTKSESKDFYQASRQNHSMTFFKSEGKPTEKWSVSMVTSFMRVRERQFDALQEELKRKFEGAETLEQKVALQSTVNLTSLKQDLAKDIEQAMLTEYNFQMPEAHGKWYEIRWFDSGASWRGEDLWVYAQLRIEMRSQSVAGSSFPFHIESLSREPLGFWYKDPPKGLADQQPPSHGQPSHSGASGSLPAFSQGSPSDTAGSVRASVSDQQPSAETKQPSLSGMEPNTTVFSA
jgi:hypothetical protein